MLIGLDFFKPQLSWNYYTYPYLNCSPCILLKLRIWDQGYANKAKVNSVLIVKSNNYLLHKDVEFSYQKNVAIILKRRCLFLAIQLLPEFVFGHTTVN
jgi:hypothetical protein